MPSSVAGRPGCYECWVPKTLNAHLQVDLKLRNMLNEDTGEEIR
jgi:hypothetical protein